MANKNKGGRPKGSTTDRTQQLKRQLNKLGCDPIEGLAKIAESQDDCRLCEATGNVPDWVNGGIHVVRKRRKKPIRVFRDMDEAQQYVAVNANDLPSDVTVVNKGDSQKECPACKGIGKCVPDVKLRADIYRELLQYVEPKKKQQEHTGKEGGPIEVSIKWVGGK